jgi:hypothetical protein
MILGFMVRQAHHERRRVHHDKERARETHPRPSLRVDLPLKGRKRREQVSLLADVYPTIAIPLVERIDRFFCEGRVDFRFATICERFPKFTIAEQHERIPVDVEMFRVVYAKHARIESNAACICLLRECRACERARGR